MISFLALMKLGKILFYGTMLPIYSLAALKRITSKKYLPHLLSTQKSSQDHQEKKVILLPKRCIHSLIKKGRSISLKPELTAPVIRAYLENGGSDQTLTKLYYQDACYRYDRPQKGRYRQFHQFGVEALGIQDPLLDIEIIALLMQIYNELGISKNNPSH